VIDRRADGGETILDADTQEFDFAVPTSLNVGDHQVGLKITSAAKREMGTLYDLDDAKVAAQFHDWQTRDAVDAYMGEGPADSFWSYKGDPADYFNDQARRQFFEQMVARDFFGARDYYRVELKAGGSVALGELLDLTADSAAAVTMESDGTYMRRIDEELRLSVGAEVGLFLVPAKLDKTKLAKALSGGTSSDVSFDLVGTANEKGDIDGVEMSLTVPRGPTPHDLDLLDSSPGLTALLSLALASATSSVPTRGMMVVRRTYPIRSASQGRLARALLERPNTANVASLEDAVGSSAKTVVDQYAGSKASAKAAVDVFPVGTGLGFDASAETTRLKLAWSRVLDGDHWYERLECDPRHESANVPVLPHVALPMSKSGDEQACAEPVPLLRRLVPKGTACVAAYDLDLDGDVKPDHLIVYEGKDFTLWARAILFDGEVSTIEVPPAGADAGIWVDSARNIDRRPGDEALVGVGISGGARWLRALTFTKGRLRDLGVLLSRSDRPFSGSAVAVEDEDGDGTPELIERQWSATSPDTDFQRWTWFETQYAWRGAHLVKVGERSSVAASGGQRAAAASLTEPPHGVPGKMPALAAEPADAVRGLAAAWNRHDTVGARAFIGVAAGVDPSGSGAGPFDVVDQLEQANVATIDASDTTCGEPVGASSEQVARYCSADGIDFLVQQTGPGSPWWAVVDAAPYLD
jgi:hypothetical protein